MSSSRPTLCDKKLKSAEIKLLRILHKIDSFKLSNSYTSRLVLPECNGAPISKTFRHNLKFCYLSVAVLTIIFTYWWISPGFASERCALEVPSTSLTLFRPPEDCSMCASVAQVSRLTNLTPEVFERRYAYSPTPVIVTDATQHWRAIKEFNFDFFANFYRNGKMGSKINECFFFAYKSGLLSLGEVFSMDEARANLSGAPWYVGWSTCYDEETRRLRQYYNRPYFLPRTAESDTIDWIFMGGPGQGAHMHVDSVRRVSWQAQVRGRKRWQLAPPPECLYTCRPLTLTVHPGEILVVDTNRWYHMTRVLPGDISITIGAEYD
ncbi:PREDICTED: uncharacterized protein LOC106103597 [Papilio polytes]|uniref:uncharacterized protein LOC106103597 n=1 Tax=Papilio polytes TaxID=76194 RepID=UPI0006769D2C|nr:PREDICTED: uncharacterized protein LOC106103597 [Papilio polytes]